MRLAIHGENIEINNLLKNKILQEFKRYQITLMESKIEIIYYFRSSFLKEDNLFYLDKSLDSVFARYPGQFY